MFQVKINTFSWSKIIKISFKRKQFFIQLRKESSESYDTLLGFNLVIVNEYTLKLSCSNDVKQLCRHPIVPVRISGSLLWITTPFSVSTVQNLLQSVSSSAWAQNFATVEDLNIILLVHSLINKKERSQNLQGLILFKLTF